MIQLLCFLYFPSCLIAMRSVNRYCLRCWSSSINRYCLREINPCYSTRSQTSCQVWSLMNQGEAWGQGNIWRARERYLSTWRREQANTLYTASVCRRLLFCSYVSSFLLIEGLQASIEWQTLSEILLPSLPSTTFFIKTEIIKLRGNQTICIHWPGASTGFGSGTRVLKVDSSAGQNGWRMIVERNSLDSAGCKICTCISFAYIEGTFVGFIENSLPVSGKVRPLGDSIASIKVWEWIRTRWKKLYN